MQMQKYKCIVSYDGSRFSGFQIQPQTRTVQGEIEAALKKMHQNCSVKVVGSGRTDAGVHAYGQVIHFDSPLQIPVPQWLKALNSITPSDISFTKIEKAEASFHARYSAIKKEYHYKIYTAPTRDPFRRHFALHYPYPLNKALIDAAIAHLIGTHDFTSFCSAKTEVDDKVRTLSTLDYEIVDDNWTFRFVGDGFLYNMVRIIVGTLLEVGGEKLLPEKLPWIIAQRDRKLAGKTAPPEGLYLWKVYYDK